MTRKGTKSISANDPRSQPAYGIAEAARYLKISPATLRSWTLGRPYPTATGTRHSPPLLALPSAAPPVLCFWNLIEAHVLRSLRIEHRVEMKAVRAALAFAEKKLGIERLLLRKDLCTDAGRLFLDRYGELIELHPSGQLAMRRVFEAHLERVAWDDWQFPVRLYPFVLTEPRDLATPIAIDPAISFGRPTIGRAGVSTATIADRIDAGETVADLARDYDLSEPEIEQAVVYERAA